MPTPALVPTDVAALLEVFRMGLATGLWDKAPVVAWADARVLAEDEPPAYVLDLALSGHRSRNDLIGALAGYRGDPPPAVAGPVLLGLLHRAYTVGEVTLQHVARTMDWLQWHGTFTESEQCFLAGVEDEYELDVAGIRGPAAAAVQGIDEYVREVLACYQPLGLDNRAAWPAVRQEIAARMHALYRERTAFKQNNAG
jgi:hypothetical protein